MHETITRLQERVRELEENETQYRASSSGSSDTPAESTGTDSGNQFRGEDLMEYTASGSQVRIGIVSREASRSRLHSRSQPFS